MVRLHKADRGVLEFDSLPTLCAVNHRLAMLQVNKMLWPIVLGCKIIEYEIVVDFAVLKDFNKSKALVFRGPLQDGAQMVDINIK
jgi:hypothetical protein